MEHVSPSLLLPSLRKALASSSPMCSAEPGPAGAGSAASLLVWSLPLEPRSCLCPDLSRGSRRGGWRRGWEEEEADFHVSQRAQAIRFVQLPKNKEALTVPAALTSLLSAPEDSV